MEINLVENKATKTDIDSILKYAASLKKGKIELSDLQQAWRDHDSPVDLREISAILNKQFGFKQDKINQIFSKVIHGKENSKDERPSSDNVDKLLKFIKQFKLEEPIKKFMKLNFGKELKLEPNMFQRFMGRKAVHEEIRDIFKEIIKEEREDRITLLQEYEQILLGRKKKDL